MRLSKGNWLVRFAFAGNIALLDNFHKFHHVTLCALFWRVVFHASAIAAVSGIGGWILALWVVEFFAGDRVTALTPFFAALIIFMSYVSVAALELTATKVGRTAIAQGFKRRFCPLIALSEKE